MTILDLARRLELVAIKYGNINVYICDEEFRKSSLEGLGTLSVVDDTGLEKEILCLLGKKAASTSIELAERHRQKVVDLPVRGSNVVDLFKKKPGQDNKPGPISS